jgi:hypothetical protein
VIVPRKAEASMPAEAFTKMKNALSAAICSGLRQFARCNIGARKTPPPMPTKPEINPIAAESTKRMRGLLSKLASFDAGTPSPLRLVNSNTPLIKSAEASNKKYARSLNLNAAPKSANGTEPNKNGRTSAQINNFVCANFRLLMAVTTIFDA